MGSPHVARPILVVEDDDNIADLLLVVLEGEGYVGVRASEGELGLALANTARPALILLDMMLPDIHGLEFVRRYRERGGGAPIVAVTAMPDIRALERSSEIATVVRKPFDIDAILGAVSATLRGQESREA